MQPGESEFLARLERGPAFLLLGQSYLFLSQAQERTGVPHGPARIAREAVNALEAAQYAGESPGPAEDNQPSVLAGAWAVELQGSTPAPAARAANPTAVRAAGRSRDPAARGRVGAVEDGGPGGGARS